MHRFLKESISKSCPPHSWGPDFISQYQSITGYKLAAKSYLPVRYLKYLIDINYFQHDSFLLVEGFMGTTPPNSQPQPGGLLSHLQTIAKVKAAKYLFPPTVPTSVYLDKYSLDEYLLLRNADTLVQGLGLSTEHFKLDHLSLAAVLAAPSLFIQDLRSEQHLLNADSVPERGNGYLAYFGADDRLNIRPTCYYGSSSHETFRGPPCPEPAHSVGIIRLSISEK